MAGRTNLAERVGSLDHPRGDRSHQTGPPHRVRYFKGGLLALLCEPLRSHGPWKVYHDRRRGAILPSPRTSHVPPWEHDGPGDSRAGGEGGACNRRSDHGHGRGNRGHAHREARDSTTAAPVKRRPSTTTSSAYLVTPGTFVSRMVEPDAVATIGRTLSIACRIVPSYGTGSSG